MWHRERHRRIKEALQASGQVATEALSREFGVSSETIRRDFKELEIVGLLRRVHGGAVTKEVREEAPFSDRRKVRRREKLAIARLAAAMVMPGNVCFVDAGSTTALLATELRHRPDITVITNSMDVAGALRQSNSSNETILLGGRLHKDVPGAFGELTLSEIARFRADFAIISPVAVNPDHGAADFLLQEAEVARAMIANSNSVMLLADYSKLGSSSRVEICGCERIDYLVTDEKADPRELAKLRKAGVGRILKP